MDTASVSNDSAKTNFETSDTITVTIRLIRSFEQRNIRFLVLKEVNLNWTTEQLINKILEEVVKATSLPKPFRTFQYDTLKVEFFAHGAKSSDPVINRDNDLFLITGQTLAEAGVKNETELSFFKNQDYQDYQNSSHHTELKDID